LPVTLGIFELLYKLSNSLFLTVYQFQQVICRFSDFGKGFFYFCHVVFDGVKPAVDSIKPAVDSVEPAVELFAGPVNLPE
jgi:hypothetical protein